jgi:hypothetical protein
MNKLIEIYNKITEYIKSYKEKGQKPLFVFFQFIIFTVFIAFVYISVKYIYNGNLRFLGNTEHFDATISAYGFSLCAIVFFDMAILYLIKERKRNKRNRNYSKVILFFFLWIMLFVFNVATILYYKYYVYQDRISNSTENIQQGKDKNKYADLKDKISELKKDRARLEKEYDRQIKILESMKEDDKEYAFYYWNIHNPINVKRPGLLALLDKNKNDYDNAIELKGSMENNSTVLNTNKKELFSGTVLIVYLFFPSFIYELLASICMALLLFMNWNDTKRIEEKKEIEIIQEPEIKEVIKEIVKEVENPLNIELKSQNEKLSEENRELKSIDMDIIKGQHSLALFEKQNKIDSMQIKINNLESNLKRFNKR